MLLDASLNAAHLATRICNGAWTHIRMPEKPLTDHSTVLHISISARNNVGRGFRRTRISRM